MTDIKWQEPPERKSNTGAPLRNWAAIYAKLQERPGEWALVAEDASPGISTGLRSGRLGVPAGALEVVSRDVAPRKTAGRHRVNVYARTRPEEQ